MNLKPGQLYLGHPIDPASGKPSADALTLEARDLTTHAVIVGMTGSGKTGLGAVLLEEALLAGVPTLILDPKGDMTNLALNFPGLAAADFQPWVNEGDAARAGLSVADFAAQAAATWKQGLLADGIDQERMKRLRNGVRWTVYSPGSTAGVPLNILGSLKAPATGADLEIMRDEIEGFASSILGLAGIEADPLSSREHILLSNLVERAWAAGQDLDLPTLIGQIHQPPIRKLGVFEMDSFFPERARLQLAMRLNGLVASPSFNAWISGAPLDIGAMLRAPDGRPGAAIVYLAHLSEEERQFAVTLILGKLVTWMRSQSGTSDLRALVYMDEVFGYAPPSANPPAKKPILTILKQARAFGVGMVLATQNPVDLDYKALSNAGTWCIGRLQTERDRARLIDGLGTASGGTDLSALDDQIGSLAKRQFILQTAGAGAPRLFTSRWAMSYLRGPLTRTQLQLLTQHDPLRAAGEPAAEPETPDAGAAVNAAGGESGLPGAASVAPPAAPALAENESPVAPRVAAGIPVRYLRPDAPWAAQVGAATQGRRLQAALAARVFLRFDDVKAGIDHREEWEAIFSPLGEVVDAAAAVQVDYDARDFGAEAPAGAIYLLPQARLDTQAFFRDAETRIKGYLLRQRDLEVFKSPELKLFSRPGESRADFATRCTQAADAEADAEAAALRTRIEQRMARLRDSIQETQAREDKMEAEVASRRNATLLSGAGAILSAFLGGRSTVSKLSRVARSVGTIQNRHATAARAGDRLEDVRERIGDQGEELERLEQELSAAIVEIDGRWTAAAGQVETVKLGLEAGDVGLDELALVWLPVG